MANKNVNTKAQEVQAQAQEVQVNQFDENFLIPTDNLPIARVTKDNGIQKISSNAKQSVLDIITGALIARGYTPVMTRNGQVGSEVNELAFVFQTVEKDGRVADQVVTINPTVKGIDDRIVKGKVYPAYDIYEGIANYNDYVVEKAEKAENSKKAKAEKIAKDKARREKAKAEKEAKAKEKTE